MGQSWINPYDFSHRQATVQEAERCFLVASGISSHMGPFTIDGTYSETEDHGHKVGSIQWPSNPEELDKDWCLTWCSPGFFYVLGH